MVSVMTFSLKAKKVQRREPHVTRYTDIEAALYRRPNLRLTARPGRVQGGEEDRYQPLSQPQLDTTNTLH